MVKIIEETLDAHREAALVAAQAAESEPVTPIEEEATASE